MRRVIRSMAFQVENRFSHSWQRVIAKLLAEESAGECEAILSVFLFAIKLIPVGTQVLMMELQ